MEIYTASKARDNLFKLVDLVASSHKPVYILGKRNKAVMMSEEDYKSLTETIYIKSIPGVKDSILEGLKEPHAECKTEIDWD